MLVKTRTKVYDFNVHLVWVTKYRKKVFDTDVKRQAMKKILSGIAQDNKLVIQDFEVMADHIHLLISFDPSRSVSDVIKSLKGSSARWWFKQFPDTKRTLWGGHLWSNSYFVGTVGNVSKNTVAQYIENQVTSYRGLAKNANSSQD